MKNLGAGIGSYHAILVRLFYLFLILFLIHLPVMWTFQSFDFYDKHVGFIIKRSLGNMGFSMTQCQSSLLMKDHGEVLQCNAGTISSLIDWGF